MDGKEYLPVGGLSFGKKNAMVGIGKHAHWQRGFTCTARNLKLKC